MVIMHFDIERSFSFLARTPQLLNVWLRDLPDEWLRANEGEKTFSAFDVVGHLVDGELTDWMPRMRRILEHGPSKPFEPFDRFAHWERNKGKTVVALLDEFSFLRAQSIDAARKMHLSEAHLGLEGSHPALGRVTLRQLIATWVVHDLNHLAQISRVLAKQYGGEVGAWREYLTILR